MNTNKTIDRDFIKENVNYISEYATIKILDLDFKTVDRDFKMLDRVQKLSNRVHKMIVSIQSFYVRGFQTADLDIVTVDLDQGMRNKGLNHRPRSKKNSMANRNVTSMWSKKSACTENYWKRSEILCIDTIFSWKRSGNARPQFQIATSRWSKTKARTNNICSRSNNCLLRFRNARPRSVNFICRWMIEKWQSLFAIVAFFNLITQPLASAKSIAFPFSTSREGGVSLWLTGVELEILQEIPRFENVEQLLLQTINTTIKNL